MLFQAESTSQFCFYDFFEGKGYIAGLQKMDRADADQMIFFFPFGEIKKMCNYMMRTIHHDWKNWTPFLLEQLTLL